jgi:hypothetical protein
MTDGEAGTGTGEGTGEGTGTGEGEKGWMEAAGLDADLQANPSLQKFKEPGALAKSYLELQTLVGGERLALPKPDAPAEDWGRVYEKLGKPEKAIDYGLDQLELPKGLAINQQVMGEIAEKMHARHLPKAMAQGVVQDYVEILARVQGEVLAQEEKLGAEALEGLKQKHGAAFDVKMQRAGKAVRALLGQTEENTPGLLDRIKLADGRALGDHPEVIELFMAIGDKLHGEASAPGQGEARTTLTPAEARAQLTAMLGDERMMTILMDNDHPEHDALQARRTSLEKQAYPE